MDDHREGPRGTANMTLDRKALELAARTRYARHTAVNPIFPPWDELTERKRNHCISWMAVDIETYLAVAAARARHDA